MDIEDIPENMEVRTKYNEYGDYTGHYNLSSAGHWDSAPITYGITRWKKFL